VSYRNKVECDCCKLEVLADKAKGYASVRIQFGPTKASNGDAKSGTDEPPAPFRDMEHACAPCQQELRKAIEAVEEQRKRLIQTASAAVGQPLSVKEVASGN